MLKLYLFFRFEPVMLEGLACDLFGGIAERLFFGPIVFGARLVAEASYVVERLIAIPACAFRLQRRNIFCQFANRELANDRSGGFDAVIDAFFIIHEFAIRKKAHDHNDKSIALSAARIKTYEQKKSPALDTRHQRNTCGIEQDQNRCACR
jgi:hypothetical protein